MKALTKIFLVSIICLIPYFLHAQDWSLIPIKQMSSIPFKYILKVQPVVNGKPSLGGTGFLIKEKYLLTNRHLVWNRKQGKIHNKVLISAGFIGYKKQPIFGSIEIELILGENLFLPEEHLKNENDFALIKLPNASIYLKTHPDNSNISINLIPFEENEIKHQRLNLSGYTGWKRNNKRKPKGRLYNAKIKFIKLLSNGEIRYNSRHVRGGNSGSPIWIKKEQTYHVVGIHRRGASPFKEFFGRRHGVAFTKKNILLIENWISDLD